MISYDGCNCSCWYFLFVKSIHIDYRSRSRFTVVVDVRLSDDDWPKMSREAEKVAVDLDYDCLSYVHFSIFV